MKFCINCKHYLEALCTASNTDPVTGIETHRPRSSAHTFRSWQGLGGCGLKARFYEPKEITATTPPPKAAKDEPCPPTPKTPARRKSKKKAS